MVNSGFDSTRNCPDEPGTVTKRPLGLVGSVTVVPPNETAGLPPTVVTLTGLAIAVGPVPVTAIAPVIAPLTPAIIVEVPAASAAPLPAPVPVAAVAPVAPVVPTPPAVGAAVPVAVPDDAPGAVAVAVIVLALTVRAEPMLVSPKLLPLSVSCENARIGRGRAVRKIRVDITKNSDRRRDRRQR